MDKKTGKIILVTENEYLPVLLKLLDKAKTSIEVLAFSFAIGGSTGKAAIKSAPFIIAEKLASIKKRKKNLTIRLYIEGRRETADRNQVTAEYLAKAGIKVRYGSTHAKGFCIDNKYVFFGSTNLTNQSITKNNETNLLIDDKKVAVGFEQYFNHLWEGGGHGGVKLDPPLLADGAFKDALVKIIAAAKKTLEFSIYFFHHTEIEKALIAAHKRGVKVRGFVHHHYSFALSYVRRTKGTADRLKATGIKDITFGPGHLFTHSKYLIRDREEIILGTGNWLHEDVLVHPQLYIQFKNKPIAVQLAKHLEKQTKNQRASQAAFFKNRNKAG